MFEFWETELSEEETQALLNKAADEICQRKLVAPAVLALEMHKPLSYIGGHAAMAAAPFLVPFLGFNFVNNYSRLLLKRENVERLIGMLEATRSDSRKLTTEDSCANT